MEPKGSDIKRYFALFVLSLAVVAGLVFARPATADAQNFTVTDFTADYYLTNQDPQGQMKVVEKINVAFQDYDHGILRALPESYKNHPLHVHVTSVTSDTGAPAGFTSSTSNGNLVLKIGNPNETLTGAQEYTITYTEKNVITFYNDHDELYWDINGDQWDQPFIEVHATLHLPAGLQLGSNQPQCFAGQFGSTARNCFIGLTGKDVVTDAYNLSTNQTLTMVVGFQKGYFHPYTLKDYIVDYLADGLEALAPILIIGGGGFLWWYRRGRDAKGTGVIIPQYDAPDKLTPLEIGAIVDFSVDNRDITATIIDLAIRKYLKIIETEKKNVLGRQSKSFSLQLINRDWSALNDWERRIMTGLFGGSGSQEAVELEALKAKLFSVATSVKNSVEKSLTDRGYFKANPVRYAGVSFGAIIIIAIFAAGNLHFLSICLIVGIVVGLIVFGIFFRHLSARTAQGVAAKEHILGLKLYMEVAEKDRLKMLQSPDARYAEKTDAPSQTVELFEKLLPYAIALQVEQQWAQKFENIYKSPPDWYVGNYAAFTAGYLVGSLNSGFAPAVNSSFSAPRSSGSSGFGGGGFAGGGGGGGGGGGW